MPRPGRSVLAAAAILVASAGAAAQDQVQALQVRAAVRSLQVYVGQQFLLQLQIEGTDQPDPVDITPLERSFTVSEAGGGSSNSTSVSIVNGRMTQDVRRGYNLNYRLAAKAAGEAVIPPLTVSAGGRSSSSKPIAMQVLPPQENRDFKFRVTLSRGRAYVGQPVTLTAEWFVGGEVQEFSFTMPLLQDSRFDIIDPPSSGSGEGQPADDEMEIALGDRRAIARRGIGEIDGRRFTVLRFQKTLIPKSAGTVTLPSSTVTFQALGARQARRRSLFDDFFSSGFGDIFGGGRTVRTLAIPSNRPRLEVLAIPAANRPEHFNGWIGKFDVEAEAKPVSVKVGEPITLSLRVRGDGMLETAQLPALDEQRLLARDFNVPREIRAAERRGGARHFTQTLRARHDRVFEIPAIELPYFDPDAGEYRIARTEPIPIEVEPSRIVTAEDAEGGGLGGPRQVEVESSDQGIAHNYVDDSALESTEGNWKSWLAPLGPAVFALALLLVPPLAFAGLLAVRHGSRLGGLAGLRSSPRARWKKAAAAIDLAGESGGDVAAGVLSALREYLGAKLQGKGQAASAWTYGDVETRLRAAADGRGRAGLASTSLLSALESVFERCEASRYAGVVAMDEAWKRQLVADAAAAVDRIEEAW